MPHHLTQFRYGNGRTPLSRDSDNNGPDRGWQQPVRCGPLLRRQGKVEQGEGEGDQHQTWIDPCKGRTERRMSDLARLPCFGSPDLGTCPFGGVAWGQPSCPSSANQAYSSGTSSTKVMAASARQRRRPSRVGTPPMPIATTMGDAW